MSLSRISSRANEAGLNFIYPLEHDTEVIVLRGRVSSAAVDKFGVVGKNT